MSGLIEALRWSGTDFTISMFVVFRSGRRFELERPAGSPPREVRQFDLQDGSVHLPSRRCREYDLLYDELPADLPSLLVGWLNAAMKAGADLAWFGFEGSFSFEHILTPDIAPSIFGVGVPGRLQLALDDACRLGGDWAQSLGEFRQAIAFA